MSRRYGSFSQESPRSLDHGSGSWGNGHQASMGSWSACYPQYEILEATHRHCDDGCLVRLRREEERVSRVWTVRIGVWIVVKVQSRQCWHLSSELVVKSLETSGGHGIYILEPDERPVRCELQFQNIIGRSSS